MSTTVAAIAARAFDKVAIKLSGVIKTATVTRETGNATYNATTGAYTASTTSATCRAIEETAAAMASVFPGYVAGPSELMFCLEGLSFAPTKGDLLTIGTVNRTIQRVGDIVGAGGLYRVTAV